MLQSNVKDAAPYLDLCKFVSILDTKFFTIASERYFETRNLCNDQLAKVAFEWLSI